MISASRLFLRGLAATLTAVLLLAPGALHAQGLRRSVGVGFAAPEGELQLVARPGLTIRGQAGLSLLTLVRGHAQLGYTRFGTTSERDGNTSVWHGGVGVRLMLRRFWVGANGYYLFGDIDSGFGFAPETGTSLGPVDVVADYLWGETEWASLRLAYRF